MRNLLLGTTAVIGAALLAPTIASAQMPPQPVSAGLAEGLTARIGGYFRFNYAFVDQDITNQPDATTGKSDFTSDAEVQAIVLGKAANGLSYGALIEFQTDARNDRSQVSKTVVDTDEMYMFMAHPMFGQLRFGDEDGVAMGLMSSGHITNFGTGGVDGDGYDVIQGAVRASNFFPAGALADSTKIIYLSPQFFGFDAGVSFGWNRGEGEDTGCLSATEFATCDRAGATTTGNLGAYRNDLQFGLRWRGTFGGVGISLSGLAGFQDPVQQLNPTATQTRFDSIYWYNVGAQVSAYGFLVGGHWTKGRLNAAGSYALRNASPAGTPTGPGLAIIDTSDMEQWFLGASYTVGAITVGANWYQMLGAGDQTLASQRRETGISVGATYLLAPGMALVAEWLQQTRKENGFNFGTNRVNAIGTPQGLNSDVTANVFILGTRIAF